MKKIYVLLLFLIGFNFSSISQTSLNLGEIAFVGLNADGSDVDFSFVLLKDVEANTTINFTDKGWNDGSGFSINAGDSTIVWQATVNLPGGTIVNIEIPTGGSTPSATEGNVSGDMLLSYLGDQIFAYQGTEASPSMISGIHYNLESGTTDGDWDGGATSNATSALPDDLVNGTSAIRLYDGANELDNFSYNCTLTSGLLVDVRGAINDVNNWEKHISTPYALNPFPCSITITEVCDEPDVPTLTAGSSVICAGRSDVINIAGNLKDATAWYVYTGSCGGTRIDTTSVDSIIVSPTVTTTYYIRGEGGCVTPGNCNTITITVNPSYNDTVNAGVCNGGSYTFPDGTTQNNITADITESDTLTTVNGCDSIIVTNLTVNPIHNDTVDATVCNGDSYTFPDGTTQTNITADVTESDTLTSVHGCDSIIVTNLRVNPTYNDTVRASICSGGSYTFPDGTIQNNITADLTESDTLNTVNGCDSIIVTNLTVNPVYNDTINGAICSGGSYTFHDGTTQNNIIADVTRSDTLSSVSGCDSIIVTNVIVNPVYADTVNAGVCNGGSYTFPDGTTQSNITADISESDTLTTVNGCDSIIVTNLTVNPVYADTVSAAVCSGGSYTFPDGTTQTNITADVSESDTLTTIHGCDSIIVTNLTVNPVYADTVSAAVCSGGSYTFPDGTTQNNITADLSESDTLTTVHGCDSIIVTNLTVNPVYADTINAAICSGGSYTFHDGTTQTNITADINESDTLTTTHGCDSIIVTNITVNPVYADTVSAGVCSGGSYTFPDGTTQNNITADISESDTLTTVHGCDSIIVTNLTVNPVYADTVSAAVCSGDSYTFPDGTTQNNITADISESDTLATIHGCDSIIVTNLTVNPVYNLNRQYSVCSGDSYTFPDGTVVNNITSDTTHTSNLTTVHGCDSIVVINLTANPNYNIVDSIEKCIGGSYTFPDGTVVNNITSDTTHTSNLTTVHGCDSIITRTVVVVSAYDVTINANICDGDSYTFPDGTTQNNITANVTEIDTLTSSHGCDSIITTNVIVNPLYNLSENQSVCSGDSYTFPDGTTLNNITAGVVHVNNLASIYGCDSVITTNLSVNPIYSDTVNAEVCSGSSYTFPDGNIHSNIISDTLQTSTLTTVHGCDSIVVTNLSVNPVYNDTVSVGVCSGNNYTFPDGNIINNITTDTTYTSTLSSVNSCDSIIITVVSVNPVYSASDSVELCNGGNYTFPDGTVINNITSDTTQTSVVNTIHGCDSVITTTVMVVTAYNVTVNDELCSGDNYTFPDGTAQSITADITRIDTLTAAYGCDSIITTNLIVNPVYSSVDSIVICYASSYTFPDGNIINNITSDTTYASNLNTTHGCDSVITITISPITEFNVSQNVTVCSGDDHTFPDGSTINNITTDTTHVSILTTTQGCDSIITTMVSVNPSFNLSETASVCSGGSYVFADGDTISNITTDTTHVSNLQTIHGCDSVITTTVHANPVYNMSETMNICCGDDCTFPDGVTVHHVSEPMIHVSNMTTVNSCDSVIQTIVNVHSVDTAVIQTDTSLIAHAENAVYQWVNCDSNYAHISGANFRAFRITQAGNYAVIIIQDQCADTSACVQVASVGIYDNKSANIRIYPNPSDGKITIEGLNPDVWGIVKIWNTVGEIILQEKVKQQSLIIDLNGEPRGTYLIQIIYDNNVYSTKILLI